MHKLNLKIVEGANQFTIPELYQEIARNLKDENLKIQVIEPGTDYSEQNYHGGELTVISIVATSIVSLTGIILEYIKSRTVTIELEQKERRFRFVGPMSKKLRQKTLE